MRTSPRVVLIQRIFSGYRKPVYDLINQAIDLKLLHGKNQSGIQTGKAEYAEEIPYFNYMPGRETTILLFPLWRIVRYRPQVVISDLALGMLNLPLIILVCKLMGIRFAFWSHGYNRKTGFEPGKRWIDWYRLQLLRMVDAHIIYSEFDKRVLKEYIPEEKIFVAQNTLDTRRLAEIKAQLDQEGKNDIKKSLGITHKYNLIFIGRLLHEKRPDVLVDIYALLRDRYPERIGIHFVGKGEMLESIRERVRELGAEEDFYFHGSIYDEVESGKLLYASDMMVMPGYLGLSVNHAFCFDCPVMSFVRKGDFPAHSPEVEYVIHGQTGYLVEDHTSQAMAEAIHNYLSDPEKQKDFQGAIRDMVKNTFPIEKMVGGALDCVDYLTEKSLSADLHQP